MKILIRWFCDQQQFYIHKTISVEKKYIQKGNKQILGKIKFKNDNKYDKFGGVK